MKSAYACKALKQDDEVLLLKYFLKLLINSEYLPLPSWAETSETNGLVSLTCGIQF